MRNIILMGGPHHLEKMEDQGGKFMKLGFMDEKMHYFSYDEHDWYKGWNIFRYSGMVTTIEQDEVYIKIDKGKK